MWWAYSFTALPWSRSWMSQHLYLDKSIRFFGLDYVWSCFRWFLSCLMLVMKSFSKWLVVPRHNTTFGPSWTLRCPGLFLITLRVAPEKNPKKCHYCIQIEDIWRPWTLHELNFYCSSSGWTSTMFHNVSGLSCKFPLVLFKALLLYYIIVTYDADLCHKFKSSYHLYSGESGHMHCQDLVGF